jgi:8-oxo-dGTP diphosphatase
MSDRSAAIIVNKLGVLLIHRRKTDRDYYVLPGGTAENHETPEETCIREVKEETGLDINIKNKVYVFESNNRYEHYFLIDSFHGELCLGGPESIKQSTENNYQLEWINAEELQVINLLPNEIRNIVLKCVLE